VHKRADGSQFTALGYDVKEGVLFVDRRRSGEVNFHPLFSGIHKAALAPENERITLRILVDRSSVEMFGNNGAVAVTDLIFPDQAANQLEVFASEGEVKLLSLDIYSMKSIWT
jgi:fructan beta-fructosidase